MAWDQTCLAGQGPSAKCEHWFHLILIINLILINLTLQIYSTRIDGQMLPEL